MLAIQTSACNAARTHQKDVGRAEGQRKGDAARDLLEGQKAQFDALDAADGKGRRTVSFTLCCTSPVQFSRVTAAPLSDSSRGVSIIGRPTATGGQTPASSAGQAIQRRRASEKPTGSRSFVPLALLA